MISFKQKGSLTNIFNFLKKAPELDYNHILNEYGRIGVALLSASTPIDTGKTASSWDYTIEPGRGRSSIYWTNSHVNKGVSIALILQYGHGTGTGGYVQGRDYINPVMRPIFDSMADKAWREVQNL